MNKINSLSRFDNAWLDIKPEDVEHLINPLTHRRDIDIERPDLHLLRIMRNPKYFAFTCKHLLNVELLPIQVAILQELWTRPFPMLIASRGFGKAVAPNLPVSVKGGWKEIKDIEVGDKVYGGDGKLTTVTATTILQKNLDFYKITLRDGRTIECCEDHMWKVWDKNKNRDLSEPVYSNLTTREMLKKFYWVRKNSKSKTNKLTKEYRYALPINKSLKEETTKELPLHPYIVGVLLGDGCITQKTISITSDDHQVIKNVNRYLPKGYIAKQYKSNKITYGIKRTDKSLPPFYKLCQEIGIFGHDSHNKFIPQDYQYSDEWQKLELIRGLMDTDGYSSKSVIEYYTVSNQLAQDFLNVARSLGLHCKRSIKQSWFKDNRYADCNRISIYTKERIFSLDRKLDYLKHAISKQGQSKYDKVFITNIEHIGKKDGHCISVDNEDKTYIVKDYIVTHNSFILAVHATLKCALVPNTKVVIAGAGLRQSKVIFEYMETIWNNAPVLRSIFNNREDGPKNNVDRCLVRFGSNTATAVPIGDGGAKIRGLRANTIIVDEFASVPPQIYEQVLQGFVAVSATPVKNVKDAARRNMMKKEGVWTPELESIYVDTRKLNQSIITGTADYDFKHFAKYFKHYNAIINTKGEKSALDAIFGEDTPEQFKNWKDYSVIRIPYEIIPEGFMDDKMVTRARAMMHMGIYQMEYGAVFTADSDGFFKRSLIESCVTSDLKPIQLASGPVWFDAMTRGNPNRQYVYGIDPASEIDNFSITVLELREDHTRIVYQWVTNKKNFKERQEKGLTNQHNYYNYCARKIRDLMKTFPCVRMGIDTQGGGFGIIEALHDPGTMEPGEQMLWPIILEDKERDTDVKPGLHIIEEINFASAEWVAKANNGMRKDFEDKVLLFPRFDTVTLGLAVEDDAQVLKTGDMSRLFDSLEDCVFEIEQLKNELATIVQTSTGVSGRDRWDTPETKEAGGKKGHLRKDRYSSLLIANMLARVIHRTDAPQPYQIIGMSVHEHVNPTKDLGVLYGQNSIGYFLDPNVCQVIRRNGE